MQDKKAPNIIENLCKLFNSVVALGIKFKTLFYLESQLAKKSMPLIMMLGSFVLLSAMSSWSLLIIAGTFLLHILLNSWLLSVVIMLLLNSMLTIILIGKLRYLLDNIRFKQTRKHLFFWKNRQSLLPVANADK